MRCWKCSQEKNKNKVTETKNKQEKTTSSCLFGSSSNFVSSPRKQIREKHCIWRQKIGPTPKWTNSACFFCEENNREREREERERKREGRERRKGRTKERKEGRKKERKTDGRTDRQTDKPTDRPIDRKKQTKTIRPRAGSRVGGCLWLSYCRLVKAAESLKRVWCTGHLACTAPGRDPDTLTGLKAKS